MKPEEARMLLHAYVDGELDPAASLEMEARLAEDAAARAACERLREMQGAVRAQADYHAAPAALAARLRARIPAAPAEDAPRRAFGWNWLRPAASLAAVALVTWGLAAAYLRPGEEERLAQDLVASHVRASIGARAVDVASADGHTVKPWLSARLDYSPPVTDFAAQGFPLVGGRLDYIGGRTVAVLVYKRRQHLVEVFVWPREREWPARSLERDGFKLERTASGGMGYWLVSDASRDDLAALQRLLRQQSQE